MARCRHANRAQTFRPRFPSSQDSNADRAAAAQPISIHVKVYKDLGANFRWNVRGAAVRGRCHPVFRALFSVVAWGWAAPAWPRGPTVNRSATSLDGSWVHSHLLLPHRLLACVRSKHGHGKQLTASPIL
jgi:hypothetical protein